MCGMRACMCTCTGVLACMCAHVCKHACICVCVHAYMSVHVCAHERVRVWCVCACTFVVGGCVHGAWCVYVCYVRLRVMCHVHKCMHARMCGLCVRVCVHGVCGRVCITCCTCVYVCMPAHVCVCTSARACARAWCVAGRATAVARWPGPPHSPSAARQAAWAPRPPPPATPRWVAGGGLHGGHTRSPLDSPSHFSPCLARPQSRVPQCSQKVGLL